MTPTSPTSSVAFTDRPVRNGSATVTRLPAPRSPLASGHGPATQGSLALDTASVPDPQDAEVRAWAGRFAQAAVEVGCDEVLAADTVREACRMAMRMADGEDAILVAGSLYVAGEARPALMELSP